MINHHKLALKVKDTNNLMCL